jgi:hypothetical protein
MREKDESERDEGRKSNGTSLFFGLQQEVLCVSVSRVADDRESENEMESREVNPLFFFSQSNQCSDH